MSRYERRPAVAGYFYPSGRDALINDIEAQFLSPLGPGSLPKVNVDGPRNIFGLISPHAGYMYSGPFASHGYYHLAADGLPDKIIIIGPNHSGVGAAISVYPGGVWHLPLGDVYVDEDLVKKLVETEPYIAFDADAHSYEHSIEVQIPFLQYIYSLADKEFRIIPIVMMQQTWSAVDTLGSALSKVLEDYPRESYLIIASTDFSHYEPSTEAEKKDRYVIDRILKMDPQGVIDMVYRYNVSMCGYGPVATLLYVASSLGASKPVLLKYGSSGDITGDYSSVVAYASFEILWK